jgi:hypothetical protein
MIELGAQTWFFEIGKRAVPRIEAVALEQLGQQSRLSAAPHALHDEHERIAQPSGQAYVTRDGLWDRPIPEAPVRRDLEDVRAL